MTRAGTRPDAAGLLVALQERSPVPLGVHLQVSDRCNHACGHCYQVHGQKGELATGELVEILDRLADSGVLLLNVSGGEATLRPDLVELLAHARRRRFAVRLFTNGYLVDEALADRIAELRLLEVHVSLYSARAEEHDAVTGVAGSFERTTRGVLLLTARGVPCVLKWPLTSACTATPEAMEALATSLGARLSATTYLTSAEDGDDAPHRRLGLAEDALAAALQARGREDGGDPCRGDDDAPCGAGSTAVAVLPDGTIRPCTHLPLDVGDARRDGLAEIAAGEALRVVAGLRWRDVHGCRDCDLRPYCSRCHADAALQTGDLLGPYPGGCRHARARFAAARGRAIPVAPPDPACGAERDPLLGPYRVVSDALVPVPDVLTDDDLRLLAAHPWLHLDREHVERAAGARAGRPAALGGALVALRVPSRDAASQSCASSGHDSTPPVE